MLSDRAVARISRARVRMRSSIRVASSGSRPLSCHSKTPCGLSWRYAWTLTASERNSWSVMNIAILIRLELSSG